MNLKMAGLGASPKKLATLGVLLAVAAYFYFFSGDTPSGSSSSISQPRPAGTVAPVTSPRVMRQTVRGPRGQAKSFRNAGDFKPSLRPKQDEQIDRNAIDPTLHLDLLAKLKSVPIEGGRRSIFDFGQAAPAVVAAKEPAPIIPKRVSFTGPKPPPPPPEVAKVVEPPPPPIPLKFYGFVNQSKAGVKRAFFLDGDDIFVASEGQVVKNRYKIVRIGVNSAVVEDTQYKNHQQTLPLVEEVTG